jgi:hypothetical protein
MVMRLAVVGMDYFAPVLVGNLNQYGTGWKALHVSGEKTLAVKVCRLWELVKADGVIFLGGSVKAGRLHRLLAFLSKFRRKKILMYWTGSDVLRLLQELKTNRNHETLPKEIIHIAAAPWLADELGGAGVQAMFISLSAVPFVRVDLSKEVPPLPKEFTVLTYVPDSAVSLYGGEHIKSLARDFPMIKIKILASTGGWWPDPPPGVQFLGWVGDPRELYVQSTLLIRMVAHDAIGGMVQEALSYGRHVIWSYPLDGLRTARDYTTMRGHVEELLEEHGRSDLKINVEGIELVKKNFLPELNINKLLEVMNKSNH